MRGAGLMAVVYFYIPAEKLEDVLDCGLKLSEWMSRKQDVPGSVNARPCISALLHPMDDIRYRDPSYKCVRLDIPAEYCTVADSDLYQLSLLDPDIKKTYIKTMVPLQSYTFGSFRKPECLVFTTVLSDLISLHGKGLGEPILYESSEALYVNNLLGQYSDRYEDIHRVLLYSFLTLQKQNGYIEGFQSEEKGLAVFYDRDMNHHITVPIPDLGKYQLDWGVK